MSKHLTAIEHFGFDDRGAMEGFPPVIEALGTGLFGKQLLSLLNQASGAEHCSMFEFGGERLQRVASASLDGTDAALRQVTLYQEGEHWRRDPMISDAQRCRTVAGSRLMWIDIAELPVGELRDVVYGRPPIRERILISGVREHELYGLSLLRSSRRGAFIEREVAKLGTLADTLISMLAKHAEVLRRLAHGTGGLSSLAAIEARIEAGPKLLSRRQAQVCSRILYGLLTPGIALDLGIGEETVATYRQRAFLSLRIATRRELLLWYLDL